MSGPKPLSRPSNAQIEAKQLSYYHPEFKNLAEVCKFMEDWKHTDGSFLLRNSFSNPGALTVTVWHKKGTTTSGLKHFNIKCFKGSYYLQGDLFSSLEKLVRFYDKCKDVPNEERLKGLRLTKPITYTFYSEIPSDDGYEEFIRRASPPLPPRKNSQPNLPSHRLSNCSDASSHTGSDSAFEEEVPLPVKAEKKGLFSSAKNDKKRNKSTSDVPSTGKTRPLPAPPRMSLT